MYRIEKREGRIFVVETFTAKPIYSSPEDGYVLYKDAGATLQVAKVSQLTDDQLLTALANSVRLPMDKH